MVLCSGSQRNSATFIVSSPRGFPTSKRRLAFSPAPKICPLPHLNKISCCNATSSQKSVASDLLNRLASHNIQTFFGIPGRHIAPVFNALHESSTTHLIQSRHESAATYSAIGYHLATGKIAPVLVTGGPGLTNTITATVSAHNTRTPLLLISGDVGSAAEREMNTQSLTTDMLNAHAVFTPITRAILRISSPELVAPLVAHAVRLACNTQNPGPVLLILPFDCAMQKAVNIQVYSKLENENLPRFKGTSRVSMDLARRTVEWIRDAKRPLLVIGPECRSCIGEVNRLVNRLGVPFVTTLGSKGLIDERHTLSLRNGGMGASLWAKRYTHGGVDVAVALGTALQEYEKRETPFVGERGKLVHVFNDSRVFNRSFRTSVGVVGEVEEFCEAVSEFLPTGQDFRKRMIDLMKVVRKMSPVNKVEVDKNLDKVRVPPGEAMLALCKALPKNGFVFTDAGEHAVHASHYLTIREGQGFRSGISFDSMGSGIGMAIGFAVGNPSRPVLCICGDGGVQMSGMEMMTAVKYRLRVLFVIFNDASYNMVFHGMKELFGASDTYDTPEVDFEQWGKALGMRSVRITRGSEITGELINSLLECGGPGLLDVRTQSVCLAGAVRNVFKEE